MKTRTLAVLSVIGALAAVGGFVMYRSLAPVPPPAELAADFTLPLLGGGSGSLSEYRGKLVLVNFWATWCAPCLKEIPLLVEMQERYGTRGLQILGPALDDPEQVRQALPRLRIHYPILTGEAEIPAAMDAFGDTLGALPFSVLISADGYLLQRKHGEFTREELIPLIEANLPQG
ncbi:MAG: TlpA family protein disulfide reductase [Panacagrimonas sp.]